MVKRLDRDVIIILSKPPGPPRGHKVALVDPPGATSRMPRATAQLRISCGGNVTFLFNTTTVSPATPGALHQLGNGTPSICLPSFLVAWQRSTGITNMEKLPEPYRLLQPQA